MKEASQRAKGGLGGAEVGNSVDFKQTKISLVLLVLLGQAKSTGRKEIAFLTAYFKKLYDEIVNLYP